MNDLFTILLLSYNRKDFLKQCLYEISKSTYKNYQVIVYDNASTDGSKEMLAELTDPRIFVIYGEKNVGQNAYFLMHAYCEGHIITLDDDVLRIPKDWLNYFLRAIYEVPDLGYLSADVIRDEFTNGAKPDDSEYETVAYNDLILQEGMWTGGWCSIIPEWVYKQCGPYTYKPELIWVPTDGFYCSRVRKQGYKVAVLNNIQVYHASGPKCNEAYRELWEEKMEYAKQGGYMK